MGLLKFLSKLFSTQPKLSDDIQHLLDLHNTERKRSGLSSLNLNPLLLNASQKHAIWMANNHRLDHNEGLLLFAKRITNSGYHFWMAGENIAMGQPTTAAVFQAWMTSPGHRDNILKPSYRDIGLGMATSNGQIYWCVDFGVQARAEFQMAEPGVFLSGPLGPKQETISSDHLT